MYNFFAYSLRTTLLVCIFLDILPRALNQYAESSFTPQVSATCKADHTMHIRVQFNTSYYGTIHARDYRTPSCMSVADGGKTVTLNISLLAPPGTSEYCGLLVNNRTQERSVPIAVRIHKTLELADDKFYVITCGKTGAKNLSTPAGLSLYENDRRAVRTRTQERSVPIAVRIHKTLELADDKFYVITCGKTGAKNLSTPAGLSLYENDRRAVRTVYNNPYTLRIELAKPQSTNEFRVKNCFAFDKINTTVPLIDENGCPVNEDIISHFSYDQTKGTADAKIRSMFKFPDSSEVHFQCDVGICKGSCPQPSCSSAVSNILSPSTDEATLLAANTVFVLDPSEAPLIGELCDNSVHPSWLMWLCIALGVLFLIMLIINIFLCSAMTCACTRTEIIEKEPSIIEEYDPYRSWHGSQYGSRYSLNGAPQHPKGYTSGGSTLNSTRSLSSHSDHYAIVHSRPGSRGYTNKGRGPSSHIGSHYSGK